MKVNKDHRPFEPVLLTLESQQEVDELYAILNCIALGSCIPTIGAQWEKLKPFANNSAAEQIHKRICDKMNS